MKNYRFPSCETRKREEEGERDDGDESFVREKRVKVHFSNPSTTKG